MSTLSAAAETLNNAFQRDPAALRALLINRVPCTTKLAEEDPLVICEDSPVLPGHYTLGALGLINAVLGALGLPLVAARFDDPADGQPAKLLGFCDYRPVLPVVTNDITASSDGTLTPEQPSN